MVTEQAEDFATPAQVPADLPAPRTRQWVSLAFYFYLLSFAGIVSAALRLLMSNDAVNASVLTRALVVFGVVGTLLGALLGLFYFRRWWLVVMGAISGLAVGLLAGALTLISSENFMPSLFVAGIGCWVLIAVMAVAARLQDN